LPPSYAPEKLGVGVSVADAGAQLSANYDEMDGSETDTDPAASAEGAVEAVV
jgi:hypothetical protein